MRQRSVSRDAPEAARVLPSEDHWAFAGFADAFVMRSDHFAEEELANVALAFGHETISNGGAHGLARMCEIVQVAVLVKSNSHPIVIWAYAAADQAR
jgi:hypothetical protein